MKTAQSEVIKVDHQSSLYNNNRLFSSATQNMESKQKNMKKSSDQSSTKQRKQSLNSIKPTTQHELPVQSNKLPIKKKLPVSSSTSQHTNMTAPSINIIPVSQQQQIKQRLQQDQKRDYLSHKVTPTLNKMLVRIINHKPKDVLAFMIGFLKDQEDKFEKKRFNDRPPNDAIMQDKRLQQVFNQTVASKFLKFKK